jgi:creatinine amidohydrolase
MRLLEELTWPELDALDRGRAAVIIPFSPLEEHGPHLPLGTDLIMARYFAEALARQIEVRRPDITAVLAPAVPLGAGTVPLRGSVNTAVDLVYDVARQMGRALARDGFKTIVFTTGHLGLWHLIALENAAHWVSRRYRVQCVAPSAALLRSLIMRGELEPLLSEPLDAVERAELFQAAHSGTLETSVMLALRPKLVRPEYSALPRQPRAAALGWRGRRPAAWQGYFGSPALARAEWGRVACEAIVDVGTTLVIDAMEHGEEGARASRLIPRLPFWLAARRLGQAAIGAGIGAGVGVLLAAVWPRIMSRGGMISLLGTVRRAK